MFEIIGKYNKAKVYADYQGGQGIERFPILLLWISI